MDSRLDTLVAEELDRRADDAGVRLLLIRRSGRYELGRHRCFLVHAGPDPFIEDATVDDPAALLDADLEALGRGERTGLGSVRSHPLYLVCTHGRKDACCAELGRPLVRALVAAEPEAVWECSHVGGDRFAGNLVCLPEGLFYGRVDPRRGLAIVDGHRQGLLDLERFRGRCWLDCDAQAAEVLVRQRLRLAGLDDVVVAATRLRHKDQASVELLVRGELAAATVRWEPTGRLHHSRCTGDRIWDPGIWRLTELVADVDGQP